MKRNVLCFCLVLCCLLNILPININADSGIRAEDNEIVGEYYIVDGKSAESAVKKEISVPENAVIEFDMMLPSLKADKMTRNAIGAGNTGGVALMDNGTVIGVIGFRGDSKGNASNIISMGGQSGDYLNALGGGNASAPFDKWMHYTLITDTANKKGNIYMTDPESGKVYFHEGRFDRYIAPFENITHIGVVSNAGYSIAVANVRVSALEVSEVKITKKEETDNIYIPYEGESSVLEFEANAFTDLYYNKNGERLSSEKVLLKDKDISFSVKDIEGKETDCSKIKVSETGGVEVFSSADEGIYTISAECSGKISEGRTFNVKRVGAAHSIQIFGQEEVTFTDAHSYRAIALSKEGEVLPQKKVKWTVEEGNGFIDENGTLTLSNATGKILLTAVAEEDGVMTKGELMVYVRSEEALVNLEGVVLKDTESGFYESNAIWGILTNSSENIDNATVNIRLFDKRNVLIGQEERVVDIVNAATSIDFKEPVALGKATSVKVKIFNSDGQLISKSQENITETGYKNAPLFADWVYGEKSQMARHIPSGVDPLVVNTDVNDVKYTYTDNYEKGVINKYVTTNNLLWYKKGAFNKGSSIYHRDGKDWEEMALPIGNGYMGAMIFGMPKKDHIQFNEETFWALGYRGTQEAKNPSFDNWQMGEGKNGYMNTGNVFIDFDMEQGDTVSNYYRDLNLDESVAHVHYVHNGVTYNREYMASYPHETIAVKYTADKAGALNFNVSLVSAHPGNVKVKDGRITITGRLKDSEQWYGAVSHGQSDLEYCSIVEVVLPKDGEITDFCDKVEVKGATEAIVYITAATDYDENQFGFKADGSVDMTQTPYKHTEGLNYAIKKAEGRLKKATGVAFEEFKTEHIKDYKSQFDTVKFSLNDEICKIPTDELRAAFGGAVWTERDENGITRVAYNEDNYKNLDTHLESLHFNYARYLMISSSRKNTMPANLQGKWCQSVAEIWGSCYCININMEMNYWFVGGANLTDSGLALVKWFNSQIPAGRVTARNMYSVTPMSYKMQNGKMLFEESDKDEDDVFFMHTKQSIMGTTDMTGGMKIQSAGNLAWLMYNLWDLYLTSGDTDLLEHEIYPIMRKTANFYTQYLYKNMRRETKDINKYPDGYYYTTWAGRSPEHGPTHEGMKYDLQLVHGMYDYVIEASEVLSVDNEKREAWEEIRDHLELPVELGEDGQIKEWAEEAKYNMDSEGNYLGDGRHRHISNLVGLYPGNLIANENKELIEGAKIVLNNRGDDATGWSCSNKFLLWARVKEGDKALELFRYQLAKKTYSNLFDTHAPFQIDGNFGSAAGVLELLMQTHTGAIEILPALPSVWKKGRIEGIKAKNGTTVSVEWEKGKGVEFSVTSVNNEDICLSFGEETKIFKMNGRYVTFKNGKYSIKNVKKGKTYTFISDTFD